MDKKLRNIDVLLFDGVNILDVAGPIQAFDSANEGGEAFYNVRCVSLDGNGVKASCGMGLSADGIASGKANKNDLLVPGGTGINEMLDHPDVTELIIDRYRQSETTRIISVCSGALLLAKAGILDGVRATTHWSREQQVLNHFPKVKWDINQIYFDQGRVMTSAGVTSAIDLSLSIIRQDCGPNVALRVARELVVYLKRSGGQDQFSDLLEAQYVNHKAIGKLIDALFKHPKDNWTLEQMADFAGLQPRTLTRRFIKHLHQTPAKFLERIRVQRAADALSNGADIGRAIEVSGFTDFQQLRRAFKRQLGSTVGNYRQFFCDQDYFS